MKGLRWKLARLLAEALEANEREAVLGDIAESDSRALRDVIGLVARRQAAMWKHPRPWLALMVLTGPLGLLLSWVSKWTADSSAVFVWMYANNWDPAFLADPAFRKTLGTYASLVLTSYLMLGCWSWSAGFLIGRVSRGSAPVNAVLFSLLAIADFAGAIFADRPRINPGNSVVFANAFYRVGLPLTLLLTLVLLPALQGMMRSLQIAALNATLRRAAEILAVATMAAIIIQNWAWLHYPFAFNAPVISGTWELIALQIVALWPIAYGVGRAFHHRFRRSSHAS